MKDKLNVSLLPKDTLLLGTLDLTRIIEQVSEQTARKTSQKLAQEFRDFNEDMVLQQEDAMKVLGVKNKSTLWGKKYIPKMSAGKYSRRVLEKAKYLSKEDFGKWLKEFEPTAYETVKQHFK